MLSKEMSPKKKQKNRKKSKISFDEETVKREDAVHILSKEPAEESQEKKFKKQREKGDVNSKIKSTTDEVPKVPHKQKPKKQKRKVEDVSPSQSEIKIPKKKKKQDTEQVEEGIEAGNPTTTEEGEKEESIRAKKRKKHQKLLEDKKLKHELDMQQKSLNYLSKWKHSKSEWKFEKLRQIWLQQNMFDVAKIPNEFWETLVDYLSGSKGQVRKVILKSALEVVEKEDAEDGESGDKEIVSKRARDIVQSLQE